MKALILAAGLGTRLRPLTLHQAKPSLPILGVPSLWFNAWHIKQTLKPSAFALNYGHAPQSIFDAVNDFDLKKFTGVSFKLSDESNQILGSSGCLKKLESWIGSDLLAVSNGDSICFHDWSAMLRAHQQSGALMTLHLRSFQNSDESYTCIETDASGKIVKLGDKKQSGVMFSGSYLMNADVLKLLPEGVSELRPQVLEPLIQRQQLFGFRQDTAWIDTGSIASFASAQLDLLRAIPAARALVETKMKELKPDCWVPAGWSAEEMKQFQFTAPCALLGKASEWLALSREYGPSFVGLEPPSDLDTHNDALVFGDFSAQIRK